MDSTLPKSIKSAIGNESASPRDMNSRTNSTVASEMTQMSPIPEMTSTVPPSRCQGLCDDREAAHLSPSGRIGFENPIALIPSEELNDPQSEVLFPPRTIISRSDRTENFQHDVLTPEWSEKKCNSNARSDEHRVNLKHFVPFSVPATSENIGDVAPIGPVGFANLEDVEDLGVETEDRGFDLSIRSNLSAKGFSKSPGGVASNHSCTTNEVPLSICTNHSSRKGKGDALPCATSGNINILNTLAEDGSPLQASFVPGQRNSRVRPAFSDLPPLLQITSNNNTSKGGSLRLQHVHVQSRNEISSYNDITNNNFSATTSAIQSDVLHQQQAVIAACPLFQLFVGTLVRLRKTICEQDIFIWREKMGTLENQLLVAVLEENLVGEIIRDNSVRGGGGKDAEEAVVIEFNVPIDYISEMTKKQKESDKPLREGSNIREGLSGGRADSETTSWLSAISPEKLTSIPLRSSERAKRANSDSQKFKAKASSILVKRNRSHNGSTPNRLQKNSDFDEADILTAITGIASTPNANLYDLVIPSRSEKDSIVSHDEKAETEGRQDRAVALSVSSFNNSATDSCRGHFRFSLTLPKRCCVTLIQDLLEEVDQWGNFAASLAYTNQATSLCEDTVSLPSSSNLSLGSNSCSWDSYILGDSSKGITKAIAIVRDVINLHENKYKNMIAAESKRLQKNWKLMFDTSLTSLSCSAPSTEQDVIRRDTLPTANISNSTHFSINLSGRGGPSKGETKKGSSLQKNGLLGHTKEKREARIATNMDSEVIPLERPPVSALDGPGAVDHMRRSGSSSALQRWDCKRPLYATDTIFHRTNAEDAKDTTRRSQDVRDTLFADSTVLRSQNEKSQFYSGKSSFPFLSGRSGSYQVDGESSEIDESESCACPRDPSKELAETYKEERNLSRLYTLLSFLHFSIRDVEGSLEIASKALAYDVSCVEAYVRTIVGFIADGAMDDAVWTAYMARSRCACSHPPLVAALRLTSVSETVRTWVSTYTIANIFHPKTPPPKVEILSPPRVQRWGWYNSVAEGGSICITNASGGGVCDSTPGALLQAGIRSEVLSVRDYDNNSDISIVLFKAVGANNYPSNSLPPIAMLLYQATSIENPKPVANVLPKLGDVHDPKKCEARKKNKKAPESESARELQKADGKNILKKSSKGKPKSDDWDAADGSLDDSALKMTYNSESNHLIMRAINSLAAGEGTDEESTDDEVRIDANEKRKKQSKQDRQETNENKLGSPKMSSNELFTETGAVEEDSVSFSASEQDVAMLYLTVKSTHIPPPLLKPSVPLLPRSPQMEYFNRRLRLRSSASYRPGDCVFCERASICIPFPNMSPFYSGPPKAATRDGNEDVRGLPLSGLRPQFCHYCAYPIISKERILAHARQYFPPGLVKRVSKFYIGKDKPVACPGSCGTVYCSEICLLRAILEYHGVECSGIFATMENPTPSNMNTPTSKPNFEPVFLNTARNSNSNITAALQPLRAVVAKPKVELSDKPIVFTETLLENTKATELPALHTTVSNNMISKSSTLPPGKFSHLRPPSTLDDKNLATPENFTQRWNQNQAVALSTKSPTVATTEVFHSAIDNSKNHPCSIPSLSISGPKLAANLPQIFSGTDDNSNINNNTNANNNNNNNNNTAAGNNDLSNTKNPNEDSDWMDIGMLPEGLEPLPKASVIFSSGSSETFNFLGKSPRILEQASPPEYDNLPFLQRTRHVSLNDQVPNSSVQPAVHNANTSNSSISTENNIFVARGKFSSVDATPINTTNLNKIKNTNRPSMPSDSIFPGSNTKTGRPNRLLSRNSIQRASFLISLHRENSVGADIQANALFSLQKSFQKFNQFVDKIEKNLVRTETSPETAYDGASTDFRSISTSGAGIPSGECRSAKTPTSDKNTDPRRNELDIPTFAISTTLRVFARVLSTILSLFLPTPFHTNNKAFSPYFAASNLASNELGHEKNKLIKDIIYVFERRGYSSAGNSHADRKDPQNICMGEIILNALGIPFFADVNHTKPATCEELEGIFNKSSTIDGTKGVEKTAQQPSEVKDAKKDNDIFEDTEKKDKITIQGLSDSAIKEITDLVSSIHNIVQGRIGKEAVAFSVSSGKQEPGSAGGENNAVNSGANSVGITTKKRSVDQYGDMRPSRGVQFTVDPRVSITTNTTVNYSCSNNYGRGNNMLSRRNRRVTAAAIFSSEFFTATNSRIYVPSNPNEEEEYMSAPQLFSAPKDAATTTTTTTNNNNNNNNNNNLEDPPSHNFTAELPFRGREVSVENKDPSFSKDSLTPLKTSSNSNHDTIPIGSGSTRDLNNPSIVQNSNINVNLESRNRLCSSSHTSDEPLPNVWLLSRILFFISSNRFIEQLFDFCSCSYSILTKNDLYNIFSPENLPEYLIQPWTELSYSFFVPVAIVSPFYSMATDLYSFYNSTGTVSATPNDNSPIFNLIAGIDSTMNGKGIQLSKKTYQMRKKIAAVASSRFFPEEAAQESVRQALDHYYEQQKKLIIDKYKLQRYLSNDLNGDKPCNLGLNPLFKEVNSVDSFLSVNSQLHIPSNLPNDSSGSEQPESKNPGTNQNNQNESSYGTSMLQIQTQAATGERSSFFSIASPCQSQESFSNVAANANIINQNIQLLQDLTTLQKNHALPEALPPCNVIITDGDYLPFGLHKIESTGTDDSKAKNAANKKNSNTYPPNLRKPGDRWVLARAVTNISVGEIIRGLNAPIELQKPS